MVYKINKNKLAGKTFWQHCPLKERDMVMTKTCEKCPWFGELMYTNLIHTKESREPWKGNIETYEFANVICTFE